MASISEAWAMAVGHHQAGRLQAAEQIYRQILAVEPNHAHAWNLLGVVNCQFGNHRIALDYIGRAISLNASASAFHSNLGNVYQTLGQLDEAVACYRRALTLSPDHAEAHNNLGNALQAVGMRQEAISCYRRAIELRPHYADAYYNLGIVLEGLGRRDEAVACYRRTLEQQPDFVEARNNLGSALWAQGNRDEAVACYRSALELKPDYADAHNNLGMSFQELGKWVEAVACYRRALEVKRDHPSALNNLGTVLQAQGKPDEAATCYRRALERQPGYADAHYNLGTFLRAQGNLTEAVDCYRRALDSRPDYFVATGALVHGLQHLCQWNDVEGLSQRVIEIVRSKTQNELAPPVSPFSFLTLPIMTTAPQQLQCARQWTERHLAVTKEPGRNVLHRGSDRRSKLAIGYLSADFHSHATAMLIAELFEKHDRSRFAIHGYSYGPDEDSPMRRRLVNALDRFVDLKDSSFLDSAGRISADEVDILVDLKGYTIHSRSQILALRPALIQVNYLGYPGTMGASFMDYILVDDFIVPADQQPFFTEKLVHLPGCYQVNDSQREIAPYTPMRAECGLPEEGFVFCCFNNCYKITPEVFGVWMKLLAAVPGSVLWLLEGNRFVPANLRREAEARGIAAERLVFAPRMDPAEHLARHRLADLFLDTFPVNAHTTASDALWAGCPVLTMAGETFVSRVAGSLLRTLGLPELVTTSLSDYEVLALRLARDASQLAELRARLQINRTTSALFDAGQFAKTLEKAYVTMWDIYVSGEQPHAFRVSPI